MDKAIAIGAKYAIDAQNKGLSNSYFTDDNYIYYFNVLNKNNNAFGITYVEEIKNMSEEVYNEKYTGRNSWVFDGQSNRREKYNNSNNKSVGYRTTSNNDVELVRGKQEQQRINEGRQNTTESIGNSKQELDNGSFSFTEAKRYDDLLKSNIIKYYRKNNGDVSVSLLDSNNNLINEFNLWSNTQSTKELGEKLGTKIYEI